MGTQTKRQPSTQDAPIKKSARQIENEKKAAPLGPHRFKPGQSGNPQGMKKGTKWTKTILKNIEENLQDAVTEAEKEEQKSLLKHFVIQAFHDNKVLVALAKKILPDLVRSEGTGAPGARVYIIQPVSEDGRELAPLPKIIIRRSGKTAIAQTNGASHE